MNFEQVDELLNELPKDVVKIIFSYYDCCPNGYNPNCMECYQNWVMYWSHNYWSFLP